jgi:hypothetical protein
VHDDFEEHSAKVKTLDPVLVELSGELDRLGYKVVSHGDHICVRLPLFSSVRVRHSGDRFRFSAQFGPFGRSGGLLLTSVVTAAVVGGVAVAIGATALTVLAGFIGVVALAHDACRFVITEGCLTRLQQLVSSGRETRLLADGAGQRMPSLPR